MRLLRTIFQVFKQWAIDKGLLRGLLRHVWQRLGTAHMPHRVSRRFFCPQQRKLMGSSAQISSGVCRSGSQEQVPKEGSEGRFQKVPESSGVCWCRFQRQVPEGSGGFRCVLAEASSRRFRRVPVCAGIGSGGKFPKFPEGSGVCWCGVGSGGKLRRQVPEASSGGNFRNVPESSGACWCIGSGGRVRKVPESSGVVCCLATLTGAAM